MRYRNTISGEVIEVDAPISGEFWEDADEAEAREEAETEDAEEAETEDDEADEPNKKGGKKA
jgi:hypothetical protein|nr:MAG TPA: hypothetical protein [Caudoviricetes sp.]